jgi:hypothetical protein
MPGGDVLETTMHACSSLGDAILSMGRFEEGRCRAG